MNTKNKNANSKLSIIIVTYNSSHIIESCLKGLNLNKHNIIVVDNASNDETTTIISNKFPQVKLIKLIQNRGYGRANNIALRQIDTDYALILNPDAGIVDKDIDLVIDIMSKNKEIAQAGVLFNYKNIYNYKFIQKAFLEGSITFLKMSVFRKIGFYDENIFLYYEDHEICNRVIEKGYINVAVPNLEIFHLRNQSYQRNLRNIYRSRWHLRSWSKIYYEELTKGKFKAKLLASWLTMFYFIKIIQSILRFDIEKIVSYIAACSGAFSSLIGLKAFKKNGEPRG